MTPPSGENRVLEEGRAAVQRGQSRREPRRGAGGRVRAADGAGRPLRSHDRPRAAAPARSGPCGKLGFGSGDSVEGVLPVSKMYFIMRQNEL